MNGVVQIILIDSKGKIYKKKKCINIVFIELTFCIGFHEVRLNTVMNPYLVAKDISNFIEKIAI